MNKLMLTLLPLGALLAYAPASSAQTYYLSQDLGVRGLMHYCTYSNGKIYTVNSTDLCPMSVEDSPQGLGQGAGFLIGQYQDGMTKVCIYNVLGEKRAVRLSSVSLCPQTYQF